MKIKLDTKVILAIFVVLFCNSGMFGFVKGSLFITLLAYTSVLAWFVLVVIKNIKFLEQFIITTSPIILFWVILKISSLFSPDSLIVYTNNMSKNIIFILIFYAISIYYCVPQRTKARKLILSVWFVDIIISSMYTIYRLIDSPMLSRYLASGDVEKYLSDPISTAGVLGYGNIYGLTFMIFCLYWVIKNVKSNQRKWIIICELLLIYTVLQAQFFIAIILVLIGVLLNIILEEPDRGRRYFRILIIVPVLVVVMYSFVKILPVIVETGILPLMISKRIQLFYSQSTLNDLMLSSRGIVYLRSLTAILETYGMGNIFLRGPNAGGHSEILDLIANYGVVVSALFVVGMMNIRNRIYNIIPYESKRNYNIIWFLFIIFSLINTTLWCQITICLILIIPLVYVEIEGINRK